MDARTVGARIERIHGQDNRLEKALRSALFQEGLRYHIRRPVPGRSCRTIEFAPDSTRDRFASRAVREPAGAKPIDAKRHSLMAIAIGS
jgi:hypothetical protein